MESNLVKITAIHDKNHPYTCVCNEIAGRKIKDKDGKEKLLSVETLGVYFRLLMLPQTWKLTHSSLADLCGLSGGKMKKCLDELKQLGYVYMIQTLNEKGKFAEFIYVLREATNTPIYDVVANGVDMSKIECIIDDSTHSQFTHHVLTHQVNEDTLYKYVINTNNTNTNCINTNNKNTKIFVNKNFRQTNNSCIFKDKNTIDQDLTVSNDFTKSVLEDHNEIKHEAGFTNLNIPKPKKIKNKVQLMEMEKQNEISTIETQEFKKLGDLTDTDNVNAQMLKTAKEIINLGKSVNKANYTKQVNKKQLSKYVESLVNNKELADGLNMYLDVRIDKSGPMNKTSVKLMFEDLQSLCANNQKIMLAVLREASKLGWNDLYLTDKIKNEYGLTNNTQTIQKKMDELISQPVVEEEDFDYVTDESGNIVQF